MRPETLLNTLTKPEKVTGIPYIPNPKIIGRRAYSLSIYKQRVSRKILLLKAKMDAIPNKIGGEWLRLRK